VAAKALGVLVVLLVLALAGVGYLYIHERNDDGGSHRITDSQRSLLVEACEAQVRQGAQTFCPPYVERLIEAATKKGCDYIATAEILNIEMSDKTQRQKNAAALRIGCVRRSVQSAP
jgi:hypothetical protein